MHTILTEILKEHPNKRIQLALGKKPQVFIDGDAAIEVSELPNGGGKIAPLTAEKIADIVNTVLNEQEVLALKTTRSVGTTIDDEEYRRHITVRATDDSLRIDVSSTPLSYYALREKQKEETAKALSLITGK